MILSKIKLALNQKRYFSSLQNHKPGVVTMGLLLDSDEKGVVDPFLLMKSELGLKDDDFKILICKEKSSPTDAALFPTFTLEDLKWKSRPFSKSFSSFSEAKFDFLVSFCSSENKLAALVTSGISARIKIGSATARLSPLFDLSIFIERDEPDVFVNEVKKYFKILNE